MNTDYIKQWLENNKGVALSDFGAKCVAIICCSLGRGVYDLKINWENYLSRLKSRGIEQEEYSFSINLNVYDGLSTWDGNELTVLVLLAHAQCVRITLKPVAPNVFNIFMSPRERASTDDAERHPTIDEALKSFSKHQ